MPLGLNLHRVSEDLSAKRTAFRSKYNIAPDEIAIGIVGRLAKVKNHKLFIDAIALCYNQNAGKKIRAFIIGDGELNEELQLYCTNQRIPFNTNNDNQFDQLITFTSWIQNVDVAYAGLDIVTLTSFNEGTPVSIIEAQAAGKPIVATNVGGITMIVKDGETALLSDISLEQFSKNLYKLIENKELRDTMGENSRNFSGEKFSYERLCSDIEKVYKKHTGTE